MMWTFHLREGVTFDDGALQRRRRQVLDRIHPRARPRRRLHVVSGREDHDPGRPTPSRSRPLPGRPDRVATAMYGAWMFSATAAKDEVVDEPNEAGTGPWMLQIVHADEETVFVRNPDYWGGWKDDRFQRSSSVRRRVGHAASDARGRRSRLRRRPRPRRHPVAQEEPGRRDDPIPSIQNYVMQFNAGGNPLDECASASRCRSLPYEDLIELGTNGYAVQIPRTAPETSIRATRSSSNAPTTPTRRSNCWPRRAIRTAASS